MNNSSYFKSTLSWEESRENLNDAILISSNDEILSKSDNEIFYDTNEYSLSCEGSLAENDISNISDAEGYQSCSEFSENTDSTSLFSLPPPKTSLKTVNVKNVPKNNLENQQNLKTAEEEYKTNEDVPLRVLLRRMFDEILGKYRKESNTICSVNIPEKTVEINNNEQLYKPPENNDSCTTSTEEKNFDTINILPSQNTTAIVSNERCSKKLTTILETSNENSDNTSYQNRTLDWSVKCLGKLTTLPFRRPMLRTNDVLLVTSDMDDTTSDESDGSIDIEMMSREIFRKLNKLKDNGSLNPTDRNENALYANEKIINTSSINNEEYNLLKSRNHKIPFIFITPPSPN